MEASAAASSEVMKEAGAEASLWHSPSEVAEAEAVQVVTTHSYGAPASSAGPPYGTNVESVLATLPESQTTAFECALLTTS